jgi:hypothetical protein
LKICKRTTLGTYIGKNRCRCRENGWLFLARPEKAINFTKPIKLSNQPLSILSIYGPLHILFSPIMYVPGATAGCSDNRLVYNFPLHVHRQSHKRTINNFTWIGIPFDSPPAFARTSGRICGYRELTSHRDAVTAPNER